MRIALLADYLEEGWPSMDLTADMLAAHLPVAAEEENLRSEQSLLTVQLLRPPMRRWLAWLPVARRLERARQLVWSADRLLNRFVNYPRFLRAQKQEFDLFHLVDHSYSQLLHELPPHRAVVTCHDLDTFRSIWRSTDSRKRRSVAFRAMTQRILTGLQRAAHVCCDSEATRDELLEHRLVPRERTSVVRLGLHPDFVSTPDPATEAQVGTLLRWPEPSGDIRHDVRVAIMQRKENAPDLLHVSSTIPRKRIDVLLDVFARIKRGAAPRARLLRVGGAFTSTQHEQAVKLGLKVVRVSTPNAAGDADVLVFPFLSTRELATIYRGATLVLVPSEAEGFGLPVIEAMACGAPVLASDLPVLREVGGDSASYAPVGHVDAWVARLNELLFKWSTAPDEWKQRCERGKRQAAQFAWERTARQMLEIYRRVGHAAGERL